MTPAEVRNHKQTWPELYCQHPRCLWRVKRDGHPDKPCPKHTPESCAECGAPFNNANPSPSGLCAACEA